MPQLQINQGPQDALLYDNSRSYFTNVGYVRTSNFQMELRDVDAQNAAQLGSTVQFVIPKAADLLGPVDLVVKMKAVDTAGKAGTGAINAWVETLGFAMIDKLTFSVGSHDVETISGDQLNIINELMKTDETRLGRNTILKTGAPAFYGQIENAFDDDDKDLTGHTDIKRKNKSRIISANNVVNSTPAHLIIPLGLFFTKHPSQYFPLCSIAGCNDVRIAIKFRTLEQLVQVSPFDYATAAGVLDTDHVAANVANALPPKFTGGAIDSCRLRCHYVHVTGPEATTLMNKEHVRLLKLWQVNSTTKSVSAASSGSKLFEIDLSFLHPVQELIITIRKTSEMNDSTVCTALPNAQDHKAATKAWFNYQGGGKDANVDAYSNKVRKMGVSALADASNTTTDYTLTLKPHVGSTLDGTHDHTNYLTVENFKLTLNGQERHPSLAAEGLDRDYLMNRLMPMLHSNTSTNFDGVDYTLDPRGGALDQLAASMDRKEIYVYPFALNPEGANPSGAVNFSKVSHAKLTINGEAVINATGDNSEEYQVDVYGVHYNWLQIKDGRALTSFA